MQTVTTCPTCNGEGTTITAKCGTCKGEGRVYGEETVSIEIPAGVQEGMQLNISGRGNAGERGGMAGDLIILIEEETHKDLHRDGLNVAYDLHISFTDAVFGTQVEVPTIDGRAKIKIPAGTQSGKIFRLKGKGFLSVIEGGEIGSGHSMIAVFEVIPTEINKGAIKDNFTSGHFADIRLQFRKPNDTIQHHVAFASRFDPIPFKETDRCYQFSAAVIMFGSLLKESSFTKDISWNDVVTLAEQSSSQADLLQKEFTVLVQQAKNLYSKVKKKKGGTAARQ